MQPRSSPARRTWSVAGRRMEGGTRASAASTSVPECHCHRAGQAAWHMAYGREPRARAESIARATLPLPGRGPSLAAPRSLALTRSPTLSLTASLVFQRPSVNVNVSCLWPPHFLFTLFFFSTPPPAFSRSVLPPASIAHLLPTRLHRIPRHTSNAPLTRPSHHASARSPLLEGAFRHLMETRLRAARTTTSCTAAVSRVPGRKLTLCRTSASPRRTCSSRTTPSTVPPLRSRPSPPPTLPSRSPAPATPSPTSSTVTSRASTSTSRTASPLPRCVLNGWLPGSQ